MPGLLTGVAVATFAGADAEGRLFNAPTNVLTGFQIVGTDNQRMVNDLQQREKDYGISLDVYSVFINCGMHNPDYSIKQEDWDAVQTAANLGKMIHVMFECPMEAQNEWMAMRNWDGSMDGKWQTFFATLLDAANGKTVFFRPFQEFTNPVTGYPWVIEQGWNTPIAGCFLQTMFDWATCNSGYYSAWDDIESNRAEFNSIVRHLKSAANAAAQGRPIKFVITADGNTVFDDASTRPKIAADLVAVADGAGDFIGLDAYSGQDGKTRDLNAIFVDGFNEMKGSSPALGNYGGAIPELGVDQGQPDRAGQICQAMRMPGLQFVVYWDDLGAGGNYKLDATLATTSCWGAEDVAASNETIAV
jgi:hypothetical protein